MRRTPRIATVALATLACGAAVVAPAAAAGGTYESSAKAEALTIRIAGQIITTSGASASVSSAPKAAASSTQVLLGPVASVTGTQSASEAETTTVGESKTSPEPGTPCKGNELTAVPGVRRLDITCGSSRASLTANGGSARGLGAQLVVEPSASGILATLGLQQPVQGATGQVYEQVIDPLVKALTGTPVEQLVTSGTTTVQDVLDKVLTLKSTARIVVAPALAQASVDDDSVDVSAQAQGVRIELLPLDGAGATNGLLPEDLEVGEPLVTITIGKATASKSADRSTGKVTSSEGQPALVEVLVGSTEVAKALGLPSGPLTIKADQSFCVPGLVGTPLETCVTVAKAQTDADGNVSADGTSVQLFKGLEGGIDIALGRASVSSAPGATTTVAAPAAGDPAGPLGELPRTGGSAFLPIAGAGLLALAAASRRIARRA